MSAPEPAAERAARGWTVLELLRWTTEHFARRGIESPRLDAECLLAHALGTQRLRLYLDFEKPVDASERARFRELVKRRAEDRVPVAYLIGEREFWSLPLRVTPDVLVPRPDTETLVSAALEAFPEPEAELHLLDLGTGSGAVALALAKERPKARILASDVSQAALEVAAANAERLGLAERVRFVHGDGLAPVVGERFDGIVSNPPYLAEAEADRLPPELAHEPREALFAGEDGTAMLRRLAREAFALLEPGGALCVELDPQQVGCTRGWMEQAGFEEIRVHRDLAERPRVLVGKRGSPGSR